MKTAMLSHKDEAELIRRWRDKDDDRAMQALIEQHIPLVKRIALGFRGYKLPSEDLVQEGVIGLAHALRTFDPSHGHRFNTLARWYVYAAMQEYVLRNYSVVRTTTSAKGKAAFFKGKRSTHVSLDMILPSGDPWIETLVDDSPNPEQLVQTIIDEDRRWNAVRKAMEGLSPRSRDIIRRRFLSDKSETLNSIGKRYGISSERVRQIEQRALEDIRILLSNEISR